MVFDVLYNEPERNGFRLLSQKEFELSARYRGADTTNTVQGVVDGYDFSNPPDGVYWTKGDSASGATANYNDVEATNAVGWHNGNSSMRSHPVAEKLPNFLGLYDMSGNIEQRTFDLNGDTRPYRGGCWYFPASDMRVGITRYVVPESSNFFTGFRVGRSQ